MTQHEKAALEHERRMSKQPAAPNAEVLEQLGKQVYEQNKAVGWWDDPWRNVYVTAQLIVTEIAEASEGERKNLMDDHLPHRKMGEVELADALIRTVDLGGRYNLTPDQYRLNMFYAGAGDALKHGPHPLELHFSITKLVFDFGTSVANLSQNLRRYETGVGDDELRVLIVKRHHKANNDYSYLLAAIIAASDYLGYDIMSAVAEKIEYNRTRRDHTREARAEVNGKSC